MASPTRDALEACTERANDLMALSRERIADELLKLLALADPAPTVRLMHERGLFAPVVPEVAGRRSARPRWSPPNARPGSSPTRFAAWPRCFRPIRRPPTGSPPGSSCRTRPGSGSPAPPTQSLGLNPAALAYRHRHRGRGRPAAARRPAGRSRGDRGLDSAAPADRRRRPDCPRHCRKARRWRGRCERIEDAWEAAGFPTGEVFERLVERSAALVDEHRFQEHRSGFIAQRPADLRGEGAMFRHLDLHLFADPEAWPSVSSRHPSLLMSMTTTEIRFPSLSVRKVSIRVSTRGAVA